MSATALRARDLRTVLDVAHAIGDAENLPAYRSIVLDSAPRLVPGDVHGYNEVPRRLEAPLIQMDYVPSDPPWWDALNRLADEHPIVAHVITTGDCTACAISDLMPRRVFHESAIFRDMLRFVDGCDQLAVSIPGRGGLVIGLAVNRARGSFSAREHAMYDAIRPFLLQGYQRALARDDDRAMLAAFSAAADSVAHPIVVLDRDGIAHASPLARRLLGATGTSVPTAIAAWVRACRASAMPPPLRLDGCVARFAGASVEGLEAIVLQPPDVELTVERLRGIGLTPREADVLALVDRGLSNAAIGRELGLASATVAKHLQNIHEKLGVPSRTAALARARALLSGAR